MNLAGLAELDGSAVLAREPDTGWMMLNRRRQALWTSPDVGVVPLVHGAGRKGAVASFLHALRELAIINPSDVIKDNFPDAGLWGLASAELAKLVPSVAANVKVDPLLWGARPLLRDPNRRGEGWIELDKVGQGAASMLGVFLLLLCKETPRILAIDGPDPGLAPETAAAFASRVGALTLGGERQLLWITTRAECWAPCVATMARVCSPLSATSAAPLCSSEPGSSDLRGCSALERRGPSSSRRCSRCRASPR